MKIKTKDMVLAALFTSLTAAGAKINLLLSGIPITLQPVIVMLSGCMIGKRAAFLSQVLYVASGLMGIPVFAAPLSGPAYVLQPSFGYIIGFAMAAYVIGMIVEKSRKTVLSFIAANMAGIAVIYFFGVAYIYFLMNLILEKPVNLLKAIAIGAAPFILKDVILGFAVSLVSYKIYSRIKNDAFSAC